MYQIMNKLRHIPCYMLTNRNSSFTYYHKLCKAILCTKAVERCYTSSNLRMALHSETSLSKLFNKLTFFSISKNRLKVTGYILFESIVDSINYPEMFQKLNLPDTFYSWFVITELHIWMLMVRYMAEGNDGRHVRNCIIEALWIDCNFRVKKLGATNPAGMRIHISQLSEQLRASLVAYDEGLQTNDMVLAEALWKRVYQQKNVDLANLDALVKYIRRQIKILDSMTKNELFEERCIKWESFKT